jgi:drug/metabolite transporter (DMT)-like permease
VLAPLCGLTAGLGWGVADFCGARGARALSPAATAFAVKALGTGVFAAAAAAVCPGALAAPPAAVACAAAAGVLMTLGMLWFYRALRAGPVCVVSPVSSAFPLVTAAVAAALGTPLSAHDGLGVVAIVAGVGLTCGRPATAGAARAVRLAAGAALAWGVATAILGVAVRAGGWQSATLVELCAGTLAFSAVPAALRPAPAALASRTLWLAAVAQQGAEAVFNLGLAHSGSPAAVSALGACYPAVTVGLARSGFGERLPAGALSGAALIVAGVAALSL